MTGGTPMTKRKPWGHWAKVRPPPRAARRLLHRLLHRRRRRRCPAGGEPEVPVVLVDPDPNLEKCFGVFQKCVYKTWSPNPTRSIFGGMKIF